MAAASAVAVTSGALMVLAAGASATPKADDTAQKVVICHATDSYKNPYTSVDVDVAGGWDGHDKHTGPVFSLDIPKHTDWGDIIPPTTYDGHDFSLNWTADGQAIWNNGCALPASVPTVTVTATATKTETQTATATETQTVTQTATKTETQTETQTVTQTVTQTAPASTVTVTAPGPTVTTTEAGPKVTVTAPGPTVTVTDGATATETQTQTETQTVTAPATTVVSTVTAPASTVTVTQTVPASTSSAASSSADGTSAAASSSEAVAGTSSSRAGSSSAGAEVAGAHAGPIPGAVDAGRHVPVSRSGLALWGSLLIAFGGIGGLMAGLRRPRTHRAH